VTDIRLRPVTRDDLSMLRRFAVEPELNGYDWRGFTDAQRPERRFNNEGGFTLEGVIRSFEFRAGEWRDSCLYSRLRTDSASQL
jgi:hypothetical protein